MNKINFAMVIHNHQPVDNEPLIVEQVYRRSYKPFLALLYKFPLLKANLHYSGYLLDWLAEQHPESIELLRNMVDRGQVEMLAGGFYEPILPCIPTHDAVGQVRLLRDKIKSLFGTDSGGFWTAERVWEPQSSEVLEASGIKYTLLDDTIFMSSGIGGRETLQPYLVESRGSYVTAFPMLKTLRYLIPWKSERTTIAFLRGIAGADSSSIAVFGDDGEKFGSWPTTFEKVYGQGWLQNFLSLLARNKSWIRTVTLSEYLKEYPTHRRAYLPAASYDEMLEWSLPAVSMDKETKRRATGFWRIYLSKYSEGGRLYDKMISVSKLVREVQDPRARGLAARELWKGQFNDVYWHGVFGGLYSPVLRRIAYHHLIRAQTLAGDARHKGTVDWLTVREQDFNGYRELEVETQSLSLRLLPYLGGSVSELDFKAPSLNVLDVLSRRKEASHDEILSLKRKSKLDALASRDSSLGRNLVYDRYPRVSFQDFLVSHETRLADFANQSFAEVSSLAGEPYECISKTNAKGTRFTLARASKARGGGSINVKKILSIPKAQPSIEFAYQIRETGLPHNPGHKFGVELNLSSFGDRSFIKSNSGPKRQDASTGTSLEYPGLGISITVGFSQKLELFQLPIATISRSEEGFRRNLQGVSLLAVSKGPFSKASDFQIRLSCS